MRRGSYPAVLAAVLSAGVGTVNHHSGEGYRSRQPKPEPNEAARAAARQRFAEKKQRRLAKWMRMGGKVVL